MKYDPNLISSASLFANCSELAPATAHPVYTCSACTDGHFLTSTFTCQVIPETCAIFNHSTKYCDVCASGNMLNTSSPSECMPVFESDACKTYDRLSRCRECKDSAKFPVMYKDATGRFHVKCVSNNLGGRLASVQGLFGFTDSLAPNERSLAVYEETCLTSVDNYLSQNPAGVSGLKMVDDDGKAANFRLSLK